MSKRFFELLSREQDGTLTDQEATELHSWINLSENTKALYDFWRENVNQQDEIYQKALETEADSEERSWRQINGVPAESGKVVRPWFVSGFAKLTAAAMITIAITAGFWYFYSRNGNARVGHIVETDKGILPVGTKATLTLSRQPTS